MSLNFKHLYNFVYAKYFEELRVKIKQIVTIFYELKPRGDMRHFHSCQKFYQKTHTRDNDNNHTDFHPFHSYLC